MPAPLVTPLQTQTKILSLIPNSPLSVPTPPHFSPPSSLTFPRAPISSSLSVSLSSQYPSLNTQQPQEDYDDEEEHIVGDCVVFEEGIFEDPYLQKDFTYESPTKKKKPITQSVEEQNLVPDEWKEAQMEINITKKERRKIAHQVEFGSKLEKKNTKLPIKDTREYLTYKEYMMSKLKPIVLDNPEFPLEEGEEEEDEEDGESVAPTLSSRVAPRNPRVAVYKGTLNDISKFFNSEDYVPGENTGKNSLSRRKLLTKEEKVLLNRRTPNLENASSEKWLPLHTLAASGEFYLVNALMKHSVDINEVDADGLTALHKAILCRKIAVTNYLLRESANPFICDKEGATLMHYAVQVAAIPTIKVLLLYNVDINLADNDGWTPLHLAIQTRRTDVVKLLLIKGADKTLRNQHLGSCHIFNIGVDILHDALAITPTHLQSNKLSSGSVIISVFLSFPSREEKILLIRVVVLHLRFALVELKEPEAKWSFPSESHMVTWMLCKAIIGALWNNKNWRIFEGKAKELHIPILGVQKLMFGWSRGNAFCLEASTFTTS